MLHHNPRHPLIKFIREVFYSLYNPTKKVYWFLFRPSGEGVKSFIFYDDKILLVKIGYSHKSWVLPGGAVDRGEQSLTAAVREIQEESGLVVKDLEYVTTRLHTHEYKKVTLHYFTGRAETEDLVIDDQEIVDAGWFSLDELPEPRRPKLQLAIDLYNEWKHGKI